MPPKPTFTKLLAILLIVAALSAAGCRGDGQASLFPSLSRPGRGNLQAWTAGEMFQLTDSSVKFADRLLLDKDDRVSLFCGANETVSFQIVVDASGADVSALTPACSKLIGPAGVIASANIKFFRMLPVRVLDTDFPAWYLRLSDKPALAGNYYDALVPIDATGSGAPFNLPAGQRLAFWVDVSAGRAAPPGMYTGSITLASASHQTMTIPIAMQVYSYVLPDARPLAVVGGFDHQTIFNTYFQRDGKAFEPPRMDRTHPLVRQGLSIINQMMLLSHEHRLDLFDRTIRPSLRREMSGKVSLDWDDYDNVVMPYLTGLAFDDRIASPAWPSPFCEDWPAPANYGGIGSNAYASLATDLVGECRRHFRLVNTADRIFTWPARQPVSPAAYDTHTKLAQLIRSGDAESVILSQLPAKVPAEALWQAPSDFAAQADIFAPPAQWLDPSLSASLARPDNAIKGLWLCPGMPPYLPTLSIMANPADIRAIPWIAAKYNCAGIFLPETLNWTGDPFNSPAQADTMLFYPGKTFGVEGVLPSVRLKRLRRGLQDAARLWVLKQRQKQQQAWALANAIVRYAGLDAAGDNYQDVRLDGLVRDAAAWQIADRILVEEVSSSVNPKEPTNGDLQAQSLAWRQFDQQARRMRVEQVRCLASPIGLGNQLRANVTLDVYNEFSQALDVQVQIEKLPPGWQAVQAGGHVAALPPGQRATITLQAQGEYIASSPDGKMPISLSIVTGDQPKRELTVYVPFLQAGWAAVAPKIDGRLGDWPIQTGNSAGGFKLVGQRGLDPDAACKETFVSVLRDSQNLYIAFRCDEPAVLAMTARPTNVLQYDQLLACSEDLVEVILDPGAKAQAPEDLYHIAVKSNGVLLAEKGVNAAPSLGKAQAWPVSAQVAIKIGEKDWIVELAIPLAAFGPAGGEKIWGVNFTRFATTGRQASSWSAARRYFYDPKSLGTMLLADQPATEPANPSANQPR
jgi:hypothetical protein